MNEQQQAVEALRAAVTVEGPAPLLHRATLARHRREAPRIWTAIDLVLAAPRGEA